MAEVVGTRYTPPAGHSPEDASAGPSRRRFKTIRGHGRGRGRDPERYPGIGSPGHSGRNCLPRAIAAPSRRCLAGYLRQTFVAVDASLRQLALHSQRIGGEAREADWGPALVARARRFCRRLDLGDGHCGYHSTFDATGHRRTTARRSHLRRLATDTVDELVADPPLRAAATHPYLLPLAANSWPDGKFGAIVATVIPMSCVTCSCGGHWRVRRGHCLSSRRIRRFPQPSQKIDRRSRRGQPLFEASRSIGANDVYRGQAPGLMSHGVSLVGGSRSDRRRFVRRGRAADEWWHDAVISGDRSDFRDGARGDPLADFRDMTRASPLKRR